MKFASFDKMDTAKPETSPLENQGKKVEQQSENQKLSPTETVDDNGRKYRTEDGGWLPNNEYTLDGIKYKTDDNGSVYKCDGKYYPDDWFVLNENLYVTDSNGEVIGGDIEGDDQAGESAIEQKETHESTETPEDSEAKDNPPIQNKQDGLRREAEVEADLSELYPPEDGYTIEQEVYLRDKDGNIVKDPVTGEARRIDFVVIKDGVVVDSIEVTSKTADKTEQSAKESRIREAGGSYIKDSNGNLVEIPATVQTRIERRD